MKQFFTIKNMTLIAIFSAITCVLAPLAVPIGPVPISLTNLVIYFAIYILGMKRGTISYLVYLLIGLVGVPVFSGFSSGPGKLFGPTGGYLIGFIPMAIITGIFAERFAKKWYMGLIGMLLGTIVCYILGTAWLAYSTAMSPMAALSAGVIPFIPGDLLKIILALIFAPQIKKALARANCL